MRTSTALAVFDTFDLPGETVIAGINAQNTIYPDKPKAIVQELASNAYDMTPTGGRPPEIFAPSALDPNFSIRDFATGMTHEFVMSSYMELFTSTKTDDDTQRGGFGLGCKTPFSYTDQFAVSSYQDNTVRSYLVFRGPHPQTGQEVPMVTHLGTEPSDEPAGLKVTIPVQAKDFDRFDAAIRQICWRFDPQPITNVSLRTPEIILQGPNFRLRRTLEYNSQDQHASAIFGDIAYKLDAAALGIGWSHKLNKLLSSPIDIFFGIDEIKPVLSRTAIDYSPEVINNILLRCEEVLIGMQSTIETALAAQPSLWEATRFWQTEFSQELREILSKTPPTYNGKKLHTTIDLDVPYSARFTIYRLNDKDCDRVNPRLKLTSCDQSIAPGKTKMIWWDDDAKISQASATKRLKRWGTYNKKDILILRCPRPELDRILTDELGGDDSVFDALLHELPEPAKLPRAKAAPRAKLHKFHTYDPRHEKFFTEDVDVAQGGLFMIVKAWKPEFPEDGLHHPSLTQLVNLSPQPIICVPATFKNALAKLPNWTNAYDHFLNLANAAYAQPGIAEAKAAERLLDRRRNLPPLPTNRPIFKRYTAEIERLTRIKDLPDRDRLEDLLSAFGKRQSIAELPTTLPQLQDELFAKYPLLQHYNHCNVSSWTQYLKDLKA